MQFSQTVQLSLALAGAAMAKDIVVQVSDKSGALAYSPNTINADMGDTVTFVFNPKNHTVTESSFAAPCVPLAGGKGFNSGFMPTADDAATQGTFTYTVADKDPHWFYCEQAKHCEMGMTGVINPPAAKPENNADSFAALAKKVNATVIDPTVQGGKISSIKAGADGSATGSGSHSTWTTAWTYTSDGHTYTKATTEDIAGFTTAPVTSHWTYTSNGQAVATQTVIAATVPVAAPTDAGSAPSSSGSGSSSGVHNAGNKLAGAGVAAAAGAAAAALFL